MRAPAILIALLCLAGCQSFGAGVSKVTLAPESSFEEIVHQVNLGDRHTRGEYVWHEDCASLQTCAAGLHRPLVLPSVQLEPVLHKLLLSANLVVVQTPEFNQILRIDQAADQAPIPIPREALIQGRIPGALWVVCTCDLPHLNDDSSSARAVTHLWGLQLIDSECIALAGPADRVAQALLALESIPTRRSGQQDSL